MNYEYEKEFEESVEELYQASIDLQKTGYVHYVGKNDAVFERYDKALSSFNELHKKFFNIKD